LQQFAARRNTHTEQQHDVERATERIGRQFGGIDVLVAHPAVEAQRATRELE
jgi:NAD(P)-dependent dehydrogenase (short-subunit alcohol dehydrogenase family)